MTTHQSRRRRFPAYKTCTTFFSSPPSLLNPQIKTLIAHKSPIQPSPTRKQDKVPFDLKGVWEAMEECQRLGLTRSIGISNFTAKKLEELLAFAQVPPAVNQVEMNPSWRQQKLKEFCAQKGIIITAHCPLGPQGLSGYNLVLTSDVLKEIANAKGKTVAQISLRWLYEQGVSIVLKSFKKQKLLENIELQKTETTTNR